MKKLKHVFIHTMLIWLGIFMGILLSIIWLDRYEANYSVDCVFDTLANTDVSEIKSLSDFVGKQRICRETESHI